jgi:hypothetical protein
VVFVHLLGITDRLKSHQNVTELLEITRSRVQRRLARMSSVEIIQRFGKHSSCHLQVEYVLVGCFYKPYLEQAVGGVCSTQGTYEIQS